MGGEYLIERPQYYVHLRVGHSLDSCHCSVMHQWNHMFPQTRTHKCIFPLLNTRTNPSTQACSLCAHWIFNNIGMINGLRNWETCSMWHKLLSLCHPLPLPDNHQSLPLFATSHCWLVGWGGRTRYELNSNNPSKLTGWGVNANAKSTMEKWLKKHSSVFYLMVLLMLGK